MSNIPSSTFNKNIFILALVFSTVFGGCDCALNAGDAFPVKAGLFGEL
jgi:hypothetical protein